MHGWQGRGGAGAGPEGAELRCGLLAQQGLAVRKAVPEAVTDGRGGAVVCGRLIVCFYKHIVHEAADPKM